LVLDPFLAILIGFIAPGLLVLPMNLLIIGSMVPSWWSTGRGFIACFAVAIMITFLEHWALMAVRLNFAPV
jgi:hypothetical protein